MTTFIPYSSLYKYGSRRLSICVSLGRALAMRIRRLKIWCDLQVPKLDLLGWIRERLLTKYLKITDTFVPKVVASDHRDLPLIFWNGVQALMLPSDTAFRGGLNSKLRYIGSSFPKFMPNLPRWFHVFALPWLSYKIFLMKSVSSKFNFHKWWRINAYRKCSNSI